jgi:hypothetical protein
MKIVHPYSVVDKLLAKYLNEGKGVAYTKC